MQDEIKNSINRSLKELQIEIDNFGVEHPAKEEYGDYSTNVAMVGAKLRGANPAQLATEIKKILDKDELLSEKVGKIEVVGGFINFYLKESWLVDKLKEVNDKKEKYGEGETFKRKKVLVEYSSPNIAKEFNVGHLRSTIIGQALYNLYRFGGAKVVGDNHLGDWGTQFGMIIAAVEDKGLELEDLKSLKVKDLEEIYVQFNKQVKEDEGLLEKARDAFARLERGEEKARQIWQESVKLSLEEFAKVYELLGVQIDYAYGESHYEKLMPEIIKEAKESGIAKVSEGALIIEFLDKGKSNFEGEEKEEMPPAMLLKSNGTTTYFTRDLATIKLRESQPELKSDLYIYEVGAEQSLHFRQVFAAAEKLWGIPRNRFKHVAHGLMLGADGLKMSTRRGTGVKMEELINKTIEKAAKINPSSADVVGVGAVKFFDLKHAPSTSYRFDWEEALRLEGDSGPYLQYSGVRIKSVLDKAGDKPGEVVVESLSEEELKVLRWLYRFEEIVVEAAEQFSPNILSEYLVELARRFNSFYNKEQIIGSDNEALLLQLTSGVGVVLNNGLNLLGIGMPERM